MQDDPQVTLQTIATTLADLGQRLADWLAPFGTWIVENQDSIRTAYAYSIADIEDLADLNQGYSKLIDNTSVVALIEQGWYPYKAMSSMGLDTLAEGIVEDPASVDEVLCEYYREHTSQIQAELVDAFPSRGHILGAAFHAHRWQEYELSVPVLLTQADGIWLDRCSRSLFSGGVEKAVQEMLSGASSDVTATLISGLLHSTWPLALSESKRPTGFADVNRHQVLHGESNYYGTETNSLKAVAFIGFVGFITTQRTRT